MGGSQSTSNTLRTISWRNYGEISDAAKLSQNLDKFLTDNLGPDYNKPINPNIDPAAAANDPNLQKILDDQRTRNNNKYTDQEILDIINKYPSFTGKYRMAPEKRILPQKPTFVNPQPYFVPDPNAAAQAAKCGPGEMVDPADPNGPCIPIPAPPPKPDPALESLDALKTEIENIFLAFQKEQNVANILSNNFEKNLKFYIRDDVFMKYSGDTLKNLKQKLV